MKKRQKNNVKKSNSHQKQSNFNNHNLTDKKNFEKLNHAKNVNNNKKMYVED
jgi:hypothetical protein